MDTIKLIIKLIIKYLFYPGYVLAYRKAVDDVAEMLYQLQGTNGKGIWFTPEAEAGVQCTAYMLKYGSFHNAFFDEETTMDDLLDMKVLKIKPNPYGS